MTPVLILILVAFSVGGVAFWRSMSGMSVPQRHARWVKFTAYFLIVMVALAAWTAGAWAITGLVAAIVGRGAYELADLRRRSGAIAVPGWIWAVYLPVSGFAVAGTARSDPDLVFFLFVVIATFDGCAQVVGQLVGRHALAPRVSPHKTVEGLLGGLAMAGVAALVAQDLSPFAGYRAFLVALPIGLVGLGGDLSASWVKRRAGVKDFRQILPGHGGVLDRFDGLIPNYAILGLIATLAGLAT